MLKDGDILICIKKYNFLKKNTEPEFTNGKKYEVRMVKTDSTHYFPKNVLVICSDKGRIRYVDNYKTSTLGKILFTIKEYRKMKLENIKNADIKNIKNVE